MTATLPGDSSARVLFSAVSVHPCRSIARDGKAGGISQIEGNLIGRKRCFSLQHQKRGGDVNVQALGHCYLIAVG